MAERVEPLVTDSWFKCYGESWKGAIVDASFRHPAKFSRALIRAIYDHAVEEGWIKPGDKILDPFGGIALGALDACRHGLTWIGMELEPAFIELGTQNIQLWDSQFKGVIPGWGTAWLYQGDSRYLVALLSRANIGGHRACVRTFDATHDPRYTTAGGNENGQTTISSGIVEAVSRGRDVGVGNSREVPCVLDVCTWEAEESRLQNAHAIGGSTSGVSNGATLDSGKKRSRSLGMEGGQGAKKLQEQGSEREVRSLWESPELGDTPQGLRPLQQSSRQSAGSVRELSPEATQASLLGCDKGRERPTEVKWTGGMGASIDQADVVVSSPPYAGLPLSGGPTEDGQGYTQGKRCIDHYGQSNGQLEAMSEGDFNVSLSSPPFGAGETRDRTSVQDGSVSDCITRAYTQDRQGVVKGNLAHMDACLSSPPFGAQQSGGGIAKDGTPGQRGSKDSIAPAGYQEQGELDGNLAHLDDGEGFEVAVSSPPFKGSLSGRGACPEERPDGSPFGQGRSIDLADYGQTEGQLGAMPGGIEATRSSPPFESQVPSQANQEWHQKRESIGPNNSLGTGQYGETTGNVGNEEAETFWGAARVIVEQVYQLLAPGGVSIWVCKDFIRKKARVPFTHQWAQLCVSVGFEWLHEHKCWMVEDNGTQLGLFGEEGNKDMIKKRLSFFRRLHIKKYPHLAIEHESVLCLRKPMNGRQP